MSKSIVVDSHDFPDSSLVFGVPPMTLCQHHLKIVGEWKLRRLPTLSAAVSLTNERPQTNFRLPGL